MGGDGDGWVHCAAGHRHWGRFGAAGLLISDGQQAILQHRAPWTHEGGTWGLPGGARDSHEDPTTTALREATEEAAIPSSTIEPVATWVEDHGGWSYTTVLARPRSPIAPHAANAESTDVPWWPTARIEALPLHHGLAATWRHLRHPPPPLSILIDPRAADRQMSPDLAVELAERLEQLARHGIKVDQLPGGIERGSVAAFLPAVALLTDAEPGWNLAPVSPYRWWRQALEVVGSDGNADDALSHATAIERAGRQVLVVTADQQLSDRLSPAIATVALSWLFALLGDTDRGI